MSQSGNNNKLTPNQLRQLYLDFFEEREHAVIPSASLVPENDPTTLFTSAGMQPLVPYLLGEKHPKGDTLVNSQKCFRAVDIEEVGDNRHTTFFEMLGNWSLGDYFKEKQLTWLFEFLTEKVGLDPQKLCVTVFGGDESTKVAKNDLLQPLTPDLESVKIWQELFAKKGVTAEVVNNPEEEGLVGRIFYYDAKKNWWSRSGEPTNMPPGEPGGPSSEIFYDFGEGLGLHKNSEWANQPCHVNCDCGRFVEIGNSVFMQYIKQADGTVKELPQKNVDFGGGLERILAAQQNTPDVFETDFFKPIIKQIEKVSAKKYAAADASTKQSFRVIADHIKAAVMLAADGVLPANKEQGYFVRRLLRRAIRYGMMIGIEQLFISELVEVVADLYQEPYPQVKSQVARIKKAFTTEEKKFHKALRTGMREIEKVTKIDEEVAFKLYQTHGFPFELTQEIAAEKGFDLLPQKFEKIRRQHADKSRTASAGKFEGGLADTSETTVKYHTATHLLHAALRNLLGSEVQQKGSNITADRLRFDFSFGRALTDEEKQQVEQQVNDWITASLPVTKQMLPKDQALKSGAIAFFEDYPDEVSVYSIGTNPKGNADDQEHGWISKEFCGGPHVENTSQIGPIKLTKEQSAGAGIRRIYMELV